MKFLERPIQNIKNTDWGAVGWVVLWLGGFLGIIFSSYPQIMNAALSIFSSNFYSLEASNVSENTSELMNQLRTPVINQILPSYYTLFNIFKVVIWLLMILLLFLYLYKKPKDDQNTEMKTERRSRKIRSFH